ncbi:hypothetical protein EBT11_07365 [bacterium]|nr:hypothetical protein [bacterium]
MSTNILLPVVITFSAFLIRRGGLETMSFASCVIDLVSLVAQRTARNGPHWLMLLGTALSIGVQREIK